jgi:hypothetical protein
MCFGTFWESEGVWQIGRNVLDPAWSLQRRFCCHACARRGRRVFAAFLVIALAVVVGILAYCRAAGYM